MGIAIAVVLDGAFAAASPADAETHPPGAPVVIPALPREGSRFGVLIVGEPDETAIAARALVDRALVMEGHTTELIVPGLLAAPRREDVLGICARHQLDGLAFVSVRHGDAPVRADVVVRDANGDLYRHDILQDQMVPLLRTPVVTLSKATFVVPVRESPSVAEPHPAPLEPLPPLLWFDERDGSALLGERLLAGGEVYRLLGHPELERRFQHRMRAKNALLATGVAAAVAGLLVVPVLWESGSGTPAYRSSTFFVVDGALLAAAVGAVAASWSIDPHPMTQRERFSLARAFNAARLSSDDDPDDAEP
ncbi:MAG TPA: hypothetical protein VHJ20_16625 [Polyangia bacterium]|nr:hypothetical protein [Polyangia bacterium]